MDSNQVFLLDGIAVHILSRPLQALFCLFLPDAPEGFTNFDWCRLGPEISGACRILQARKLAYAAEVDPCKVVCDPKIGEYRPAEPEEIHLAEDGYMVYWKATEALVPGGDY
jgi:hypothetical protein